MAKQLTPRDLLKKPRAGAVRAAKERFARADLPERKFAARQMSDEVIADREDEDKVTVALTIKRKLYEEYAGEKDRKNFAKRMVAALERAKRED